MAVSGYMRGVFWICMVCMTSALNDVLMREAGYRLPSMQVAFFRTFFALLTLLPVITYKGWHTIKTVQLNWHIVRSLLGFCAIALWCYGVSSVPLAIVSTVGHVIPLFVLVLAYFLLKEKIGWQRVVATLGGFSGILLIVCTSYSSQNSHESSPLFYGMVGLLFAALCFALSDIVNKKMVHEESHLSMLFYFALGTTLAGMVPAYKVWVDPTMTEILYLLALGAGGNMILFFLLKAFAATDVSALAPFRYVELLFALAFGYFLYGEIPNSWAWVGIGIIVPCTFAVMIYESNRRKETAEASA